MTIRGKVFKRFIAVVLSAMLIGAGAVAVNAATVKPGAYCSKVWLKKTVGNKQYTCIRVGTKKVWNKGVIIKTAPSVSPSPSASQKPIESSTSALVEQCRLRDARTNKQQPNNVGFPHSADIVPHLGTHRVMLIPIDFSDSVGDAAFLKQQNELMAEYQAWYKHFSNGKASAEVITSDVWFRAPKKASEYVVGQTISNAPNPFIAVMNATAQDFINAVGNKMSFEGIHGIYFLYPKDTQIGIKNSILGRGVVLQTPAGSKNLFYFGAGQFSYELESRLAKPFSRMHGLWVHEILHSQGIAIHAPGNGFNTGLGQAQEGYSLALDAWEIFLLGWFDDKQVFCQPASTLTSAQVELQPLELSASGYKIAVVPIDQYEAIVVESRRAAGFSDLWDPSVDNGSFVYTVDTRLDNDRTGESNGKDNGNDRNFPKWAFYLAPDGKQTGSFAGGYAYRDYFFKTGSSVTYKGVKVSVVVNGNSDVISISRQ